MNKQVEQIKAEIERRILNIEVSSFDTPQMEGGRIALKAIRDFINSLLEEAANYHKEMVASRPHTDFANRDFIADAFQQKQQLISKACDWLEDKAVLYVQITGVLSNKYISMGVDFIDDFKKYMKEQIRV